MGIHHASPERRELLRRDGHNLQQPEIRDPPIERADRRRSRGLSRALERVPLRHDRQADEPLPLQLQHRLAATHLLEPPGRVPPIQPFAHPQRQLPPRDGGLVVDRARDSLEDVTRKCSAADGDHGRQRKQEGAAVSSPDSG